MPYKLPVVDSHGHQLVDLVQVPESAVDTFDVPCPLALVVVRRPDATVLVGLNRRRHTWELPGGVREHGEAPRAAALRELAEETGLVVSGLEWVGVTRFHLVDPPRGELAALYLADVGADVEPAPVDGEMLALTWLDPEGPLPPDATPIDLAIASWATGRSISEAAASTTSSSVPPQPRHDLVVERAGREQLLGDATVMAEQFIADRFPAACGAVLAGSSAAGTRTPTSDLDLVLLFPGAVDGERSSLAATYEHGGRVVEVFAYSPRAFRLWAERDVQAHRPVILTMLTEGVVVRPGSELHELRAWADEVLAAGPQVEQHALDLRRYMVSALLDDLHDAVDPGERALLLSDAFTAVSELLLLTHGQWLGSGKWLLRRLRAWDRAVADRLSGAFASGDREGFIELADELLAPLGGRLQAGFVR